MSYFLSAEALRENTEVSVSGEEALHIIQSRRMQIGDTFHLQGPDERRFHVTITSLERGNIKVKVEHEVAVPPESSLHITLCQALTKEKALDTVIQKVTELGVQKLYIFNTERTPERLPDEIEGRLERWQKIATEAAKQCDRVHGVDITWLAQFDEVLEKTRAIPYRVVLAQGATEPLPSYLHRKKPGKGPIAVFVGSEGGWSGAEADILSKATVEAVKLGPRILRADTAAIAAISVIQSLYGDMS